MQDSYLSNRIDRVANIYSFYRRIEQMRSDTGLALGLYDLIGRHIPYNDLEAKNDWYNANCHITSEILKGNIKFTEHIEPSSYHRLEETWLHDVKKFNAYLIWKKRADAGLEWLANDISDYFQVANEIRNKLTLSTIKASTKDFKNIEIYLKTHYLTDDGNIDLTKSDVHRLISRKAERIWEVTQGKFDKEVNWFLAETYVRMFYENIIFSVMKNEQGNESVTTCCSLARILKAFQFSKHPDNRFLIINCFEAAIAIYFLNPDFIKELWQYPESCNYSMVYIDEDWPKDLYSPPICSGKFKYNDINKLITYDGKMNEKEKDFLLNNLTSEKHKKTVENLFIQSNYNPELMTL